MRDFFRDLPDAVALEATEVGITTVPGLSAVTISDEGRYAIGISHGFLMALIHSYLPFTRLMREPSPALARDRFQSFDNLSKYLLLDVEKFAPFSDLFVYTWQYLRLNLLFIVLHEAGHVAAQAREFVELADEEDFADEYAAHGLQKLVRGRTSALADWLGVAPNSATLFEYMKFSSFYYFSVMTALRPIDSVNAGHASERTRYERLLARIGIASSPVDQGALHLEKFREWSRDGGADGEHGDDFQLMMKNYILARLRPTNR